MLKCSALYRISRCGLRMAYQAHVSIPIIPSNSKPQTAPFSSISQSNPFVIMSESSFYPSSKMFLDPKVPLMRAQRIASVLESASSLSPSEFIALNRCMDHAEAILDRVPTTRVRDRTSHTTDPEGSAIVDRRGMSTVDSTSQISTQPDESTSDQPLGKRIRAEIIQADLSQTEAAHTKVLGETRVLTDHLAGLVSELRMREEEARVGIPSSMITPIIPILSHLLLYAQ